LHVKKLTSTPIDSFFNAINLGRYRLRGKQALIAKKKAPAFGGRASRRGFAAKAKLCKKYGILWITIKKGPYGPILL